MSSVSVVIVTKNEEDYIARCLESVLASRATINIQDIVVVDSASKDRTVEISRSLGIRVISLRGEWGTSAAAGRFVGFYRTDGDLVMFVDGDCVLERDWIHRALPYFNRQEVAGIMGYLEDWTVDGRKLRSRFGPRKDAVDVPWLRGIAMYRRSAMAAVGTFNPYLEEEEEAELAFRLRRGGWRLLSVPHKMGDHLRGESIVTSLLRQKRRRRYSTIGRTLRYAINERNGLRFLFNRCRSTVVFTVVGIGCLMMLSIARPWHGGYAPSSVWLMGILLAAAAAIMLKTHSVVGPVLYFTRHLLILKNLLVGALTTSIKDPSSYPLGTELPGWARPGNVVGDHRE